MTRNKIRMHIMPILLLLVFAAAGIAGADQVVSIHKKAQEPKEPTRKGYDFKVTLKKGESFKVKANITKLRASKKLMPEKHISTLRYLSSNTKVATVNKEGKIKAKAKGTCSVYVYTHNGISKKIKVAVK